MDISATSAMVLGLMDGTIHTSRPAREFLGMLDLGAGDAMRKDWMRFWPHYGEVVKNRKSCILSVAKRTLQRGVRQVVILGAGLDALSLELCWHYKECRVFEVDKQNMAQKQVLIDGISSHRMGSITCIESDLEGPIEAHLKKAGWDERLPTLVIMEGLSYYITQEKLWDLVGLFRSPDNTSRAIIEYLIPEKMIPEKWAAISAYPFDEITKKIGLDFITRYDVESMVRRLGAGKLEGRYRMSEMEIKRTGKNEYFGKDEGWIEVCELAI